MLGGLFSFVGDSVGIIFTGLWSAIASILYSIWMAGAAIVNLVEVLFRKFAGLDDVYKSGTKWTGDLSTIITSDPTIKKIFTNLMIFAFIMLVFFTILQIIREQYKAKDGGNPYILIFRMFKAMALSVFITAAVVVGMQASKVILTALENATGNQTNGGMAGIIFGGMAASSNYVIKESSSNSFSSDSNIKAALLTISQDQMWIWDDPAKVARSLYYGGDSAPDNADKNRAKQLANVFVSPGGLVFFSLPAMGANGAAPASGATAPTGSTSWNGNKLWAYDAYGKPLPIGSDAYSGFGTDPTQNNAWYTWGWRQFPATTGAAWDSSGAFSYSSTSSGVTTAGQSGIPNDGSSYAYRIAVEGDEDNKANSSTGVNFKSSSGVWTAMKPPAGTNNPLRSLGGMAQNYFYIQGQEAKTKNTPTLRAFYNAKIEGQSKFPDYKKQTNATMANAQYAVWIDSVFKNQGHCPGLAAADYSDASGILKIGNNGTSLSNIYGLMSYYNPLAVYSVYDVGGFNWIIGFGGIFLVIGVYLSFLFGLIQRLAMLGVLFVFAPVTLAFFPFDDGAMFNNGFVKPFYKQAISSYAPILSLNLFFPIMSAINTIQWFDPSQAPNIPLNVMANTFVAVGLLTMLPKMRSTIQSMLGADAIEEKKLSQMMNDAWSRTGGVARDGYKNAMKAAKKPADWAANWSAQRKARGRSPNPIKDFFEERKLKGEIAKTNNARLNDEIAKRKGWIKGKDGKYYDPDNKGRQADVDSERRKMLAEQKRRRAIEDKAKLLANKGVADKVDDLLNRARNTTDPKEKQRLLDEAASIINGNAALRRRFGDAMGYKGTDLDDKVHGKNPMVYGDDFKDKGKLAGYKSKLDEFQGRMDEKRMKELLNDKKFMGNKENREKLLDFINKDDKLREKYLGLSGKDPINSAGKVTKDHLDALAGKAWMNNDDQDAIKKEILGNSGLKDKAKALLGGSIPSSDADWAKVLGNNEIVAGALNSDNLSAVRGKALTELRAGTSDGAVFNQVTDGDLKNLSKKGVLDADVFSGAMRQENSKEFKIYTNNDVAKSEQRVRDIEGIDKNKNDIVNHLKIRAAKGDTEVTEVMSKIMQKDGSINNAELHKFMLGEEGGAGRQGWLNNNARMRREFNIETAGPRTSFEIENIVTPKQWKDTSALYNMIFNPHNGIFKDTQIFKMVDKFSTMKIMAEVEKIEKDKTAHLDWETYGESKKPRFANQLLKNSAEMQQAKENEQLAREYAAQQGGFSGVRQRAGEKAISLGADSMLKILQVSGNEAAMKEALKGLPAASQAADFLSKDFKLDSDKIPEDQRQAIKDRLYSHFNVAMIGNDSDIEIRFGKGNANSIVRGRGSVQSTDGELIARTNEAIKEYQKVIGVTTNKEGKELKDFADFQKDAEKRLTFVMENTDVAKRVLNISDSKAKEIIEAQKLFTDPDSDFVRIKFAYENREKTATLADGLEVKIGDKNWFTQVQQQAYAPFEKIMSTIDTAGVIYRDYNEKIGDRLDGTIPAVVAAEQIKLAQGMMEKISNSTGQLFRSAKVIELIRERKFQTLSSEFMKAYEGEANELDKEMLAAISKKSELHDLAEMFGEFYGDANGEMRGSGLACAQNMIARTFGMAMQDIVNEKLTITQNEFDQQQRTVQVENRELKGYAKNTIRTDKYLRELERNGEISGDWFEDWDMSMADMRVAEQNAKKTIEAVQKMMREHKANISNAQEQYYLDFIEKINKGLSNVSTNAYLRAEGDKITEQKRLNELLDYATRMSVDRKDNPKM